jgi:predicted nucleic acid-binding protein
VASPSGLIDTGALLAILDDDDRWHESCLVAFETARLPLATSAAVLTELFYMLGGMPREERRAWQLLRSGAVAVLPIGDDDLAGLEALMTRYADRPMDFADATLVHLAEREGLNTIHTVDRSDFEIYRIGSKKVFRILPPRN